MAPPVGRVEGHVRADLGNQIRVHQHYCESHQRPDRIPDIGGALPRLTTRQFRRTLAWFIARRPGGAIAGALQYRHQRIHMFEGYAGTSDSGFRDEVQAEDALARGQYLGDLSADTDRPQLTGPAGAEAEQRLADLTRHAVFHGQVVTDEVRLRRIIARHDPRIYPGTFVTCVYNPDRAGAGPTTPRPPNRCSASAARWPAGTPP
ncbi:hypothetical protein ACFVUB_09405 [Streptomyces niveus]|uniref:hypothetical protein n=1 Tax=Streptomyces niveus TaxID=193462 RepID=UPI0036D911C3